MNEKGEMYSDSGFPTTEKKCTLTPVLARESPPVKRLREMMRAIIACVVLNGCAQKETMQKHFFMLSASLDGIESEFAISCNPVDFYPDDANASSFYYKPDPSFVVFYRHKDSTIILPVPNICSALERPKDPWEISQINPDFVPLLIRRTLGHVELIFNSKMLFSVRASSQRETDKDAAKLPNSMEIGKCYIAHYNLPSALTESQRHATIDLLSGPTIIDSASREWSYPENNLTSMLLGFGVPPGRGPSGQNLSPDAKPAAASPILSGFTRAYPLGKIAYEKQAFCKVKTSSAFHTSILNVIWEDEHGKD